MTSDPIARTSFRSKLRARVVAGFGVTVVAGGGLATVVALDGRQMVGSSYQSSRVALIDDTRLGPVVGSAVVGDEAFWLGRATGGDTTVPSTPVSAPIDRDYQVGTRVMLGHSQSLREFVVTDISRSPDQLTLVVTLDAPQQGALPAQTVRLLTGLSATKTLKAL
jgi:hypothetical protein